MTGTDRPQSPVPSEHAGHADHDHNTHQQTGHPVRCGIVPPYLLAHLATVDDPRFSAAAAAARRSLRLDDPIRSLRSTAPRPPAFPGLRAAVPGTVRRTISDAYQLQSLPGRTVRTEGQPPVDDVAVNEAYTGLGDTHELFWSRYQRDSIDGRGLPLDATVHYAGPTTTRSGMANAWCSATVTARSSTDSRSR